MTELDSRCLDAFPDWLRTLAGDARALAGLLENEGVGEPVRRHAAGALHYLFKSLDLIPDGIEDLGYVDDAFVLRVAAASATENAADAVAADDSGILGRLAKDAELVKEFLGDDYRRLETFVAALESLSVRGRSVDEVVTNPTVRSQFVGEVKSWASAYHAPAFSRDEKNLVKLKSFMSAKLPE